MSRISPRLLEIVDALPLNEGMRILEIGGAPGVAARAILERLEFAHVLIIDRSAKGVALIESTCAAELASGRLSARCVAVENAALLPGEAPYDLAFAVRVGALDGRHPEAGIPARERIRNMLVPGGKLFIDGGDPIREVDLG